MGVVRLKTVEYYGLNRIVLIQGRNGTVSQAVLIRVKTQVCIIARLGIIFFA